jgi:hypothetical protein
MSRKIRRKTIHALKKTNFIARFMDKGFSSLSRIQLFQTDNNAIVYLDLFLKKLEIDCPYYVVSPEDITSGHSDLVKNKRGIDVYNDYYVFATFMPPGDNKMILTFNSLYSKDSYNLCH